MRSFAIDRAVHERHLRRIAFREFARVENMRRYNRQRGFIINPYNYGVGGPTDPDYASVVLLLQLEGPDTSTTITDTSSSPLTCLAQGTIALSTAQSRWGTSSARGNYSVATANNIRVTSHANLNLPGDLSIETSVWWIDAPDATYASPTYFAKKGVSSSIEYWFLQLGNDLYFYYTTDGTTYQWVTVAYTPTTGQWNDIGFFRSGSNAYFFVNGTQQGSTQTLSGTIHSGAQNAGIFTDLTNASTFNGYYGPLRVTKGVCRHTTSYTPAAFPNS